MKVLRRYHAVLWLALALAGWHCQRDQPSPNRLARVGARVITVEEFTSRMELSPPPAVESVNGFHDTRAWLELLIGEKLLAHEAEALGLDRTPAFQQWRQHAEEAALARELYRQEIQSRVRLRESEIDSAMVLAQRTLHIRFFRSERQAEAQRFHALVQAEGSFARAMRAYYGSEIAEEQYHSRFSLGDGDADLEQAVFALAPGEITAPVSTSRGYFVVELVSGHQERPLAQSGLQQQRAAVSQILRTRKADVLSAQFVQQFMRDQNVVLKGRTFAVLADYLTQHLDFAQPVPAPKFIPLDDREYEDAHARLRDHLDDPLIVFHGGQWTLRATLERLRLRQLPFNRESPAAMRQTLERDLQALVRDTFLAQEGRRRNLHRHPAVQEEVRMWVDHHLYTLMVQRLQLQPRPVPAVVFPPAVENLRRKYRVSVHAERLQQIVWSGLPMIAVHPGRPHQLVVPLWPAF